MKINPYIECAKVINTHGCHGGIKLECWCNTPDELAALKQIYRKTGDIYRSYRVLHASVFKQFVLADLEGIDTMDQAMELKGTVIYAKRDDFSLAEGEYFIADLIGLDVVHADTGKKYGKLVELINRGASDIYVIETPNGERMMPAVDEFVDHVELEKGIFVRPIEGMLD